MTASVIPFQLILVPHIWISLPLPLIIFPAQKNQGIPLIRFQIPFMLPLETLLVCWPPLPFTHNFLNQIILIMILDIPSLVITLSMEGQKEDTAPCFMVEKDATKIEFLLIHMLNYQEDILLSWTYQNGLIFTDLIYWTPPLYIPS